MLCFLDPFFEGGGHTKIVLRLIWGSGDVGRVDEGMERLVMRRMD